MGTQVHQAWLIICVMLHAKGQVSLFRHVLRVDAISRLAKLGWEDPKPPPAKMKPSRGKSERNLYLNQVFSE